MTVATGGEGATGPLPAAGFSVAPVPAYSPGATVLTDRFTRAVDYAREVHAGDTRKGTTIPSLSHLLAVAALVLEHGGSEDQAIAALLHDAAEDHGGRAQLARIRAAFGDGRHSSRATPRSRLPGPAPAAPGGEPRSTSMPCGGYSSKRPT